MPRKTQRAKGSAEAATSSSQHSKHTIAGMMNVKLNNTKIGHSATGDPQSRTALFDLEEPINDSKNMASILGSLLHDIFDKDHSAVTGHRECYFISEGDVSNLIFAASHLQRFIKSTLDTWNVALDQDKGN